MDDILARLKAASAGLTEAAPERYELTPQEQQLNDLRLSSAQKLNEAGPTMGEIGGGTRFAMALGNMLQSSREGKGTLGGALQYNQQMIDYDNQRRAQEQAQLQQANQAARSTQLLRPESRSFDDAMKLVGDQMTLEFKTKQKELDRDVALKKEQAKQKFEVEKARIKDQTNIDKENRKQLLSLTEAETSLESNLAKLEDAYKTFTNYSQSSWLGGTGPIATGFGAKKYTNEATQLLDSKFKSLNLEEMARLFKGMSKAIDSDAERRAFESAQPSITNDDAVNEALFKQKIEAARSLLQKTKQRKLELDPRYKRYLELQQRHGKIK